MSFIDDMNEHLVDKDSYLAKEIEMAKDRLCCHCIPYYIKNIERIFKQKAEELGFKGKPLLIQ